MSFHRKTVRAATRLRGFHAEQAVTDHLMRLGHTILYRNYHVGHLELDIVARDGSTIIVVEVRYRGPSAWTSPLESIDASKQRRLLRATEILWDTHFVDDPTVTTIRIDVACVETSEHGIDIRVIENAITHPC